MDCDHRTIFLKSAPDGTPSQRHFMKSMKKQEFEIIFDFTIIFRNSDESMDFIDLSPWDLQQ